MMDREARTKRANIFNAVLISIIIVSFLAISTPEEKRKILHFGKEAIRISVIVITSILPYSREIFGLPDSLQFTYLEKEYTKIKLFPGVVSKTTTKVDKKGFLKDNSDGMACFDENILTQKSFSEVLQYYSEELRREGWECVDNRGRSAGGSISYTFKRKGDDYYQWIIGVDEEDINKNKSEGEKETILFSVGIYFR